MRSRLLTGPALLLLACAQASSPPGGERDRFAPRIIATTPEQGAVVPAFNDEVVIKFDETLSEQGVREDDMVMVSPETGEVDADRSGDEIKVKIAGGWQRGVIYHVTVLPGLADRHRNQRPSAYELVFSTGPAIPATVLGGVVIDRITGKRLEGVRVTALNRSDSTLYATITDTAGFFALRSLPPGIYRATAFLDVTRDRKIDFREPRDSALVNIANPADTMVQEFSVLAPDTTPARLLKAEAIDSMTVRLTFDDYFETLNQPAGVAVSMWQLPDSNSVLVSGALLHVRAWEARKQAQDTTRRVAPPAPPPPGAPPATTDTTRALPSQELIWAMSAPLRPRTRYRVTVLGIRNIAGILNGGGSVTFETPAPPRPPAAPADTARPPARDTTNVRPTPRDTIR